MHPKWLAKYKFKNWVKTDRTGKAVDQTMREDRAKKIAEVLSDNTLWHSHGRGISRETLESDEIKLKIDDLAAKPDVLSSVRKYHHCLTDFMKTRQALIFVHSRAYF